MVKVTVRAPSDNYANQERPNNHYPGSAHLWVSARSSAHKRVFFMPTKPFPLGVTILSAKLYVRQEVNFSGEVSISAHRITSPWQNNTLTWNKQPSVTGGTTVTKTSSAKGTWWVWDVTASVQTVANGAAPWYGFSLRSTSANDRVFYSSNAAHSGNRPYMEIEWATYPDEPERLNPTGGLYVEDPTPTVTFTYNDPGGNDSLVGVQVQIGSTESITNAGTAEWDSGEVATSEPLLDTGDAGYPGLAAGATAWWRVRVKDDSGLWSPWADAVQFGYAPKGTITSFELDGETGGIYSASPSVSWTFSGTQRAFQLFVSRESDVSNILWTSGKLTSTATAMGIPFGVIDKDDDDLWHIELRVYDDKNRVATPGNAVYVTAVMSDLNILYYAEPSPVTTINAVSDMFKPVAHLHWTATGTTPDMWEIQRSEDDGVTWDIVDEEGGILLVDGDGYSYDDGTAPQYKSIRYRVMAVMGMLHGQPSITSGSMQIRRFSTFLSRPKGVDPVMFLNTERTREHLDVQDLIEVMSGPPVLITQRLGGEGGSVTGVFADGVLQGVTAKMMKSRFMSMRAQPGTPLVLYIGDEALTVAAYNMQIDSRVKNGTILYVASFDWVKL